MTIGTERMAAFVRDAMAGSRFGDVDWVAETGSTNDDLIERARLGEGEQVLITDLQTAGRGRRGRVWTAPTGTSVLMSVLLRDQRIDEAFWSVGAVALAAAGALNEDLGVPATLKWPNDLVISGAKVAGVLAQVQDRVVVVGIGINANWPVDAAVPTRGGLTPTSINWHLGPGELVDRASLVVAILRRAERLLSADPAALRERWREACSTIGSEICLDIGHDTVTGTAVGVAPSGALVVDVDGQRRHYEAGDVIHLRPAS